MKKVVKKERGITLIALVVTIVVLLILAGVSMSVLFGDSGIINRAKEAQNKWKDAEKSDLNAMDNLDKLVDEQINGKKPLITDSSLKSDDRVTNPSETVIAKDVKENQVVVPGGFKISDDSGESVQQGIVIEDKDGNQFVWVPVSNINGDGSNKIIKDDGSEVEITLGRYTFATDSFGTPTIIQKGSEYDKTTVANVADGTVDTKYRAESYYYELKDSRISNEKSDKTGTNTTAKNLKEFIEKTEANKGYYIARYEASYGSGYNSSGTTTAEKYGNARPLSKVSTGISMSISMQYTAGTLWNHIEQPQAAIVSRNMYKNDKYVESDLVNSYAWDTAIVYIQAMGNINYANKTDGNANLKNTGKTGDERCKIFDMCGNTQEWTTEYSSYVVNNFADSKTYRGGAYCYSNYYTSYRHYNNIIEGSFLSFRPIIYVK